MYITGTASISPQLSYEKGKFLEEIKNFEGNRLFCQDPEYKNYIGPVQIRRMGRIVKMGITSAKMAMEDAGVPMPDAIIVGTGLGCLEDTEKFLRIMLDDAEQTSAPTPFISSTHNSVAGAIALQIKCLGYNYTYVHKGFSFISCVNDAFLQIHVNGAEHVLVGGIDEMTDTKYNNNGYINYWNTKTPDSLSVFDHPALGSLAGEGSSFFMLSKERTENSYARILAYKQLFTENPEQVATELETLLNEHKLQTEEYVFLEGNSNNLKFAAFYEAVEKKINDKTIRCTYKQLCGSYYTSDAFGLWVAANILKTGQIPAAIRPSKTANNKPKFVVLYDHVSFGEHVFQILSV